MDEWLIRTVMALYPEACIVVLTYVGLSEGWSTSRVSCCTLMTCYLWPQQWSSFVDAWLNGELAFLTKD